MNTMCLANDRNSPDSRVSPSLEKKERPSTLLEQSDPVLSQEQPRRRKPARRVSFQAEEVVKQVDSASCMTEEQRNDLWYPAAELAEFKNRAREACRKMRHDCDEHMSQAKQAVEKEAEVDEEDSTRGLEHRISLERQKNKFLSIQVVLKGQERFPDDPDQLARIASRCTAWAKDVALQNARRDFAVVYDPASAHKVPTSPSVSFPTLPLKRRDSHRDQRVASPLAKRPHLIPHEMRQ